MCGVWRKYFASSTLNTFAWLNVRCLGASKQERMSFHWVSGLCSIQCCDKNLSGHCLSARLKAALRQTRRKSTDSVGGVFSASVSVNTNHFFAGLPWNVFSVNNKCRLIPKQCVARTQKKRHYSLRAEKQSSLWTVVTTTMAPCLDRTITIIPTLYVHCTYTVPPLYLHCLLCVVWNTKVLHIKVFLP